MNEELNKVWHKVCEKQAEQGYEALLEWEGIWLDVGSFLLSLNNGGLVSYFYNSYADHCNECLDALAKLDAMDVRSQLLDFCELFPGGVPANLEHRNAVINGWNDEIEGKRSDEIDDAILPLLPDLERRLDEFVIKQMR